MTFTYAGWETSGTFYGIEGYLDQTSSTPVAAGSGKAQFTWINLCSSGDCSQWVQIGAYQGEFLCCSSLSTVHVYVENMDRCGSYYSHDYGAPPAENTRYQLTYNFAGAHTFTCPNGVPFTGYTYLYTKGSTQVQFNGVLTRPYGVAYSKTEIHNGSPMTYNYIGCKAYYSCGANSSYGLHLRFSQAEWILWGASVTSNPVHSNPPFLHTYSNYWSFETCPRSC